MTITVKTIPCPNGHRQPDSAYGKMRARIIKLKRNQCLEITNINGWPDQGSLYRVAKSANLKIASRKIDGGYRVWRVFT